MFALGTSAIVSPLSAFAQASGKPVRIGFFYFGSRQSAMDTGRYATFTLAMRDLGYIEGKNLTIESRYAEGKADRLPALVAELANAKLDVIVATGSSIYRALQIAAVTVPVVVTVTVDPITAGLAATMAHPGANFTGLTDTAADLNPKLLELLMATVPKLNRVGLLLHPENYLHPDQLKKLLLVAQKLGVQIVIAEAANADTIANSLAFFVRERTKAFIALNDTFFTQQAKKIATLAAEHKLASITANYDYAAAGGLMNYGPNLVDNFKRAATYVDKILKGAKPGDLPFEAPTRYHLVVNRKTAKLLGLTIPQTLMVSADKVIE
jgi:putative ABC transport system substrate-binding protein